MKYCLYCNKKVSFFNRHYDQLGNYYKCDKCGSKVLSQEDTIQYILNKNHTLDRELMDLRYEVSKLKKGR